MLIDGDFGFGMRRLSIIDIAGGHQPMETADGRFSIIFNGEIYNHLKLREELLGQGYVFRTHSDTETILAAYQEWREETWHRLDGMFAVAIWDRRERRLTLARDHLGIKPLHYTSQNGGLAFGSELKALMPVPGLRFDIDPRALHDLFTFGHIRTDRSIYAQVHTLPPGHSLTITQDGDAQIRSFWRPVYAHMPARSEKEWIEAFREQWRETIRSHLLADVEVGAFLSGGIDSSAVVAMMRQLTGEPVKTFTIGFPIERYNEAPYAEAVARHLGCIHTSRIIDLGQARDLLPQIQRCYDEPFADPSAIPTWYLGQLAREHVKVVLSGDGGDELFMGYKRHLTARRMASIPPGLRQALGSTIASLPSTPVRAWNRKLQRWQKTMAATNLPDGASRFFALTQITSSDLRKRMLSDEVGEFETFDLFERLRDEYFADPANSISRNELEQLAYADLTLNLPCAMLTKVDRASMAHSLEVRVPFLSSSLVEWAMSVPAGMKIKGKTGKYLLREAIKPWMPEGVVDRRKQGFQIPLAEWFDGDFGSYAQELWHESGAADLGYLRVDQVDAVFAEHRAGKRDHGRFLYALAQFSLWWADRKVATPDPPGRIAIVSGPTAILRVPRAANDDAAIVPARASGARRIAFMLALVGAGWFLHDLPGTVSSRAEASTFVDDAVSAYRAEKISDAVGPRREIVRYDRSSLARVTGVHMPGLPASWKVFDVQALPRGAAQGVNIEVQLPGRERLSIFGMKTHAMGQGHPVVDKREQDNVVYWEEGDFTFAVVGSLPSKKLLQLVAQLDPDGAAVST
jgi:asparagine synthase (glutamine-hydrolysing)